MDRKNLIEAVEKETQDKVKSITWIYGIGEDVADGGDPLYHYDVTLQVELSNDKYISVTATNFCDDRSRVIATTVGSFEPYSNYNDFGDISEDLECKLFDYLETYGDELERPSKDFIIFESM